MNAALRELIEKARRLPKVVVVRTLVDAGMLAIATSVGARKTSAWLLELAYAIERGTRA